MVCLADCVYLGWLLVHLGTYSYTLAAQKHRVKRKKDITKITGSYIMSYLRVFTILVSYTAVLTFICWVLTSCQTPQKSVRYVRPVPVERAEQGQQSPAVVCPYPRYPPTTPRLPELEIDYFHGRCRAIYERPKYCMTYYRQVIHPDTSRHIDILCGLPN